MWEDIVFCWLVFLVSFFLSLVFFSWRFVSFCWVIKSCVLSFLICFIWSFEDGLELKIGLFVFLDLLFILEDVFGSRGDSIISTFLIFILLEFARSLDVNSCFFEFFDEIFLVGVFFFFGEGIDYVDFDGISFVVI